jgi:hypothetical protein
MIEQSTEPVFEPSLRVDMNVSVANEGQAIVQSAELNHGDSNIMWMSESNSCIKQRTHRSTECNQNLASRAATEPKRVHEVNV